MFKFFKGKSKKKEKEATSPQTQDTVDELKGENEPAQTVPAKKSLFSKLKEGLTKTRASFTQGLSQLFLGRKVIDEALLEELETILLSADVGIEATEAIINELTQRVTRKDLKDPQALSQALQDKLYEMIAGCEQSIDIGPHQPFVILMAGINGAGKTTTIGKLAKQLQQQGLKVMLAAGDTFRAAAVEQLKVWGERNQIPVIAQQQGADSASVLYDAFQAAKSRGMDILIADTAGRLHTQDHLMEELKKMCRVIKKLDPEAPHEVLLVLDAGIGQNALVQAKTFHQAINVTGLVLTKLDGTAKGGIVFAIAESLKLPIRYLGVGESIDDLKPFDAKAFVQALFAQDGDEHAQAESPD